MLGHDQWIPAKRSAHTAGEASASEHTAIPGNGSAVSGVPNPTDLRIRIRPPRNSSSSLQSGVRYLFSLGMTHQPHRVTWSRRLRMRRPVRKARGARATVRACAVARPAVLADPAAVPGLAVADANERVPAARGTRDMEAQAARLEREQVAPAAAARRVAFRRLTNRAVGANATCGDRAPGGGSPESASEPPSRLTEMVRRETEMRNRGMFYGRRKCGEKSIRSVVGFRGDDVGAA